MRFFERAPYAQKLFGSADLPASMLWFGMSRSLPSAGQRFEALRLAMGAAQRDLQARWTPARALTSARVAFEIGQRAIAVEVLGQLTQVGGPEAAIVDEPFLCFVPRFEALDPSGRLGEFALAQAIEGHHRSVAFSSWYLRISQEVARLRAVESLGFGSEEIRRRIALMVARATGEPFRDPTSD